MRKRSILLVLVTLFSVLFISGCKQNVGTPEDNAVVEETQEEDETGGHVYGFSCSDMSDPFYEVLKESVGTTVEAEKSRMLVRDAGGDADVQISQIEELINEGVEAVFLCPVDSTAITPALEALDEADIPVVNIGVRVQETGLTEAFVGSDDYNAGKLCGEDVISRRPAGGSLVIVEHPDSAEVNERITGFEEAIADKGFEVERIDSGDDYSTIADRLSGILSGETQIDAIMCGNDQMAEQVLSVLEEEEKNNILVYSVGGSPAIKSALAEIAGPMTGIGAISPINIGKTAAKTAAAILESGVYEPETYVETFFINKDNVDMYGTDGWQ